MRRKKFTKERFYRRFGAQGFVKGGYVNWNGELEHWQLPYCNFPNLAKAAGEVADKFLDVAESFKKFQPYGDGLILGRIEDFEICGSDFAMSIRM